MYYYDTIFNKNTHNNIHLQGVGLKKVLVHKGLLHTHKKSLLLSTTGLLSTSSACLALIEINN